MSVRIRLASTDPEYTAWNSFVLSCPSTSFFATTHWLNGYADFGLTCRFLLAMDSQGTVVGGAPLVVYRWGPLRWIAVPHGPCAAPGHFYVLPELIAAIDDYASDLKALFTQVSPFERAAYDKRWEDYAARHSLPYDPTLPLGAEDGVTDLLQQQGYRYSEDIGLINAVRSGQIVRLDVEDLLATFRAETRRKLHRTSRSDELVVYRVDSLDSLAVTYELLKENAARYGGALRPWPTFRSALIPAIEDGTSLALTAYYNTEPCSTLVAAYGGRRAAQVFAATRRIPVGPTAPAYQLVYEAMLEARRRGFQEYDLTTVTEGGGVEQFKRSFRPAYYRLSESLVKTYHRTSARACLTILPLLRKNRHLFANLMYRARTLRKTLHRRESG